MTTKLSMIRGDDQSFTVTVVDGGVAVDLTGATLRFTAKRKVTDADDDAVIVKTSTDGIEVPDPEEGVARIDIEPADTSDLTRDTTLVWDLQVTGADDKVHTLDSGTLRIRPDVSRTSP